MNLLTDVEYVDSSVHDKDFDSFSGQLILVVTIQWEV